MGKDHLELSREQIEERLEKIVAFKIYKEHFLPDLEAYNKKV
jgi:hypothetical protein